MDIDMKRLTDVIGQCGYIGSPNRENMYSLGSLSDLYLLEAYNKFPNCEDKKWLSEYAKGKAVNEAIQKLGKHEDIEDKFGIDFTTLSKALEDGIWYRLQDGSLRYIKVALALLPEGWVLAEFYPKFTNVVIQLYNPMHRYGVEWALTKEELK